MNQTYQNRHIFTARINSIAEPLQHTENDGSYTYLIASFTFLLLLFSGITGYAQSPWLEWSYKGSTSMKMELSEDIVAAGDGSVYHVATFSDSIFSIEKNKNIGVIGPSDLVVEKLDSFGNPVWNHVIQTFEKTKSSIYFSHLEILSNGNIIFSFRFIDTLDLDPLNGHQIVSVDDNRSRWMIMCLSPSGKYIWHSTITGSWSAIGRAGLVATDDGFIAGGMCFGDITIPFESGDSVFAGKNTSVGLLVSFNSEGNAKWAKVIYSSEQMYFNDLACDTDNNIYATGSFRGLVDLDPGPGEVIVNDDALDNIAFLLKLDNNGNYVWGSSINTTNRTEGKSVAVDRNGDVYWGGNFVGSTDMDPGPDSVFRTQKVNLFDCYVIKTSSNGAFKWVRTLNSTSEGDLISLNSAPGGGVYVLASDISSVEVVPFRNPDLPTLNFVPLGRNHYILELDTAGDPLSLVQMVSSSYTYVYKIDLAPNEDVLFAGAFVNFLDVDSVIVRPRDGHSNSNNIVGKLSGCPRPKTRYVRSCKPVVLPNGQTVIYSSNEYLKRIPKEGCDSFERWNVEVRASSKYHDPIVYPNPNTGNFTLKNINSNVSVQLFNSTGQLLYSGEAKTIQFNVDLNLANGIYFLRVSSECGVFSDKIVVQRK